MKRQTLLGCTAVCVLVSVMALFLSTCNRAYGPVCRHCGAARMKPAERHGAGMIYVCPKCGGTVNEPVPFDYAPVEIIEGAVQQLDEATAPNVTEP